MTYLAHAPLLRLIRRVREPVVGLDMTDVGHGVAVLDGGRGHRLLDLGLVNALDLLVVLGGQEHEGDRVAVCLVAVNDAHFAVDDAQVAAGRDVAQADECIPAHEAPVPSETVCNYNGN